MVYVFGLICGVIFVLLLSFYNREFKFYRKNVKIIADFLNCRKEQIYEGKFFDFATAWKITGYYKNRNVIVEMKTSKTRSGICMIANIPEGKEDLFSPVKFQPVTQNTVVRFANRIYYIGPIGRIHLKGQLFGEKIITQVELVKILDELYEAAALLKNRTKNSS